MTASTTTVSIGIDVAVDPAGSFDILFDELAAALVRDGYRVDVGPDGCIAQDDFVVGRIVSWEPGERAVFEWRSAAWNPETTTEFTVLFEPTADGTRITLEHRGLDRYFWSSTDLVGWFAREVAAQFVGATAPAAFGDWLTDRQARKPSGASARENYGDPRYHYPNFRVILDELALTADDYLLEVGCGGGALLGEALKSGCEAAAVDHSIEMVELARRTNRDAVDTGRLEIHEASADELPFPDGTFTCAVMTGVFGFLSDPVAVLQEIRRVLAPDGRIVVLGSDPELRGTEATPEPMASRMSFYESDDLERVAIEAGFGDVRVERHNLRPHAKDVGIPDDHLSLFDFPARFLLAKKS